MWVTSFNGRKPQICNLQPARIASYWLKKNLQPRNLQESFATCKKALHPATWVG